jgi:Protein of unknown function (DUF4058)
MPLLDHFHPPLQNVRHWESFHSRWAVSIADEFNRILPPRYFAEVESHLGSRVEADVAEFETISIAEPANDNGGGVAVQTWAPPVATMAMPAALPDVFEVQIRDDQDFVRLLAVIELISPGNKDRDESRRAFAAKCAAYLQVGVGVLIVDIVTNRHANLHNELIHLMGQEERFALPVDPPLYAVAYRPARREDVNQIEMWPAMFAVGGTLPLLPLALRRTGFVPVDLEATYMDARQRSRL